ncbi:MAG: type II toxin-antitoxin system HicB family antitoxin [Thermoplasmatota archaeon]
MESRYPTVIEWSEEDHAYIALVPDLPGCFADGKTREGAARNAERVIREWIETARHEGRLIPSPSLHLALAMSGKG